MDRNHICDLCSESIPTVGEAGRTGHWRTARPVVDNSRCTHTKTGRHTCFICWLYCPEAVISKTTPIQIDLEYCKGCGICAEECPTKAIVMVEEVNLQRKSPPK